MNPKVCICNRNIRIIASYVDSKIGHHKGLFDGLPYPTERFGSAEDYFLDEDEWTSHEVFKRIFRRAKKVTGDPDVYFKCGASAAALGSWGRFSYFTKVFQSPSDGFRRTPFFNRNFNATKEIQVLVPPYRDRLSGKYRTLLKVDYTGIVDVHDDYLSDPYRRGILSAIPTVWGLPPATVKQTLNPYDPMILFSREDDFKALDLDPRMEGPHLTLMHPRERGRTTVGKRVFLDPEDLDGKPVFLGRYRYAPENNSGAKDTPTPEALLITADFRINGFPVLRVGEIFRAPYFILDVTYDELSVIDRAALALRIRKRSQDRGKDLIETITRLRETIESRDLAFVQLEKANAELIAAKKRVDDDARNLQHRVDERTRELLEAKEELVRFNRDLEAKVSRQVKKLKRYEELRRYLSPKLTEKILSKGGSLESPPQRKMMTVVFTDIRNFSACTDNLEPEELFHLLDRYLSDMTAIVHAFEGTLNKIIGDGMLIFFGDPVPFKDHAQRAVRMSIRMQRKASEISGEWRRYGHELGIGIGITTGYVTVGSIGSEMHRDYTVIGNQVNAASRLASIAEPGQILISHRTFCRIQGMVSAQEVGEIPVKGIHCPIKTYAVSVNGAPEARESRPLPMGSSLQPQ